MSDKTWGVGLFSREPWGPCGVEWKESEDAARSAAIVTARANPGATVMLVRLVSTVRCPIGEATWEQATA